MPSTKPLEPFYVVFDGMPGPESCRFVETETQMREGVGPDVAGYWDNHTSEGFARLGPYVLATPLVRAAPALIDALESERHQLQAEVKRLRAGLSLLLDAVSDLDDDARTAFPETAVVAAVTALAKE